MIRGVSSGRKLDFNIKFQSGLLDCYIVIQMKQINIQMPVFLGWSTTVAN